MEKVVIKSEWAEKADTIYGRFLLASGIVITLGAGYQFLIDDGGVYYLFFGILLITLGAVNLKDSKSMFKHLIFDPEGIRISNSIAGAIQWKKLKSVTYRRSAIEYQYSSSGIKGTVSIPWLIRGKKDEIRSALEKFCTANEVRLNVEAN